MNAEVTKAIKKANKKENTIAKIGKWWHKNDYKVYRTIFFPIWLIALAVEKINKELDARQEWSGERVNEILNYYIPRRADWIEETKEFYLFDSGYGWGIRSAKKYLKRKDYRFWENYNGLCGGEIRRYLISQFELDGFVKVFGDCSEGYTEITFKLIEEN